MATTPVLPPARLRDTPAVVAATLRDLEPDTARLIYSPIWRARPKEVEPDELTVVALLEARPGDEESVSTTRRLVEQPAPGADIFIDFVVDAKDRVSQVSAKIPWAADMVNDPIAREATRKVLTKLFGLRVANQALSRAKDQHRAYEQGDTDPSMRTEKIEGTDSNLELSTVPTPLKNLDRATVRDSWTTMTGGRAEPSAMRPLPGL